MGTKIWGPLGWMTIHSVSAIYPDKPTQSDRLLVEEFIHFFRETIPCPYCKTHFTTMINKYKQLYPNWSSSRQNLFIFICRAHNTVNRRLDKPIYKTVSDCIETLKNATSTKTPIEFRKAYLDYLLRNWSHRSDGEGIMMMGFVRKMIKINNEYLNIRDIKYSDITIQEDNVLNFNLEDLSSYKATRNVSDPIYYRSMKIGFKNGSIVKR
jgi:hypothetical protein